MKKIVSIALLACFCLAFGACGAAGAAVSATETTTPAPAELAAENTSAPTPEPTPEPLNLQPIVDDLNAFEAEQREKGIPFTGVYEIGEDGRSINYKLALDLFEYITFGAEIGEPESVESYNKTLNELPATAAALEEYVHEQAPDVGITIILMLEKSSDQVVAVVSEGRIIYDAINGVGKAPKGITPIIPPETDETEATPAS